MKDKQEEQLKNELSKLPNYASPLTWEEFVANSDEIKLKTALEKLPIYSSPIGWESMNWNSKVGDKKLNFVQHWRGTILKIAATLLVFFSAWTFFTWNTNAVSHTKEQMAETIELSSETDQEYAFVVQNLPKINKELKQVKQIQNDFEHLSNDQKHLENVLSKYETNPDLIKEWVKIENEKADLLNELALYI